MQRTNRVRVLSIPSMNSQLCKMRKRIMFHYLIDRLIKKKKKHKANELEEKTERVKVEKSGGNLFKTSVALKQIPSFLANITSGETVFSRLSRISCCWILLEKLAELAKFRSKNRPEERSSVFGSVSRIRNKRNAAREGSFRESELNFLMNEPRQL